MSKRRVLIKKVKSGKSNVYSYVTFQENNSYLMTKICIESDIEDIKKEIEELKPFINKSSQLKRELADCETLLRLINEREIEKIKDEVTNNE